MTTIQTRSKMNVVETSKAQHPNTTNLIDEKPTEEIWKKTRNNRYVVRVSPLLSLPSYVYKCGIRNKVEDNHAYSEGLLCRSAITWSPDEYEPKQQKVQLDANPYDHRSEGFGRDVGNVVETYDFDESSRAWRANKRATGNGCYSYLDEPIPQRPQRPQRPQLPQLPQRLQPLLLHLLHLLPPLRCHYQSNYSLTLHLL